MSRPRLYFIACCFPPFGRGNSLTNACVANYLADDFATHVVCMERSDGLLLSYQEDQSLVESLNPQLQIHRVRAANWWNLNELLYAVGALPCYYLNWAWSAWRQRDQWLRSGVIMAVYPVFSDLVLGYALKRSSGNPLIVDFRDDFSGVMTRGWRRLLRGAYRWVEGRILKRADAVTVTTEFLREDLIARHGLDPDKVTAVYNIVPPAGERRVEQEGGGEALNVIYAGAMSPVQKPEILLKAYAQLQAEHPTVAAGLQVDFFGPESPYFKLQIRKQFVDGTKFHGFCDRDQIAERLARTDIGFFSLADATYAYATPTKLFEYIEFGIPILAVLPKGAARDLVERHEIGLVVEPGDVEGLARALSELSLRPELRERMRANMAKISASFSADEQARKWRDIAHGLGSSEAGEPVPDLETIS